MLEPRSEILFKFIIIFTGNNEYYRKVNKKIQEIDHLVRKSRILRQLIELLTSLNQKMKASLVQNEQLLAKSDNFEK